MVSFMQASTARNGEHAKAQAIPDAPSPDGWLLEMPGAERFRLRQIAKCLSARSRNIVVSKMTCRHPFDMRVIGGVCYRRESSGTCEVLRLRNRVIKR
jgi:hypothetical protein